MHRLIQLIIALCVLSAFVVAPIAAVEVDIAAAKVPSPFVNAALADSANLTVPEDPDDAEESVESVESVEPTNTTNPEKRRLFAPVVIVLPAVVDLCLEIGIAVMACSVFLAIADKLGMHWDSTTESWDDFVLNVQNAVNNLLASKEWVRVSSGEGQAGIQAVYEEYQSSGGGSKGKKDGKWYLEGRVVKDANGGEKILEVKLEPLTEDQALNALKNGKDIITLTKDMAKNLVKRFNGLTKGQASELKFEGRHDPANGWLHHLHVEVKNLWGTVDRLHIWSWK